MDVTRSLKTMGLALALAVMAGAGVASAGQDAVPGERTRLQTLAASERDFLVGVAAQRRGDLGAAERAYASALERDPSFVEAMVNRARVLIELEDWEGAAAWLDSALAQHEDYPAVHAAQGLLALRTGNTAQAVDELTRARTLAPDDVEVLTNLGAALLEQGLLVRATELLERAQRLDPDGAEVAFDLGLASDRAGDQRRAVFHYRRFMELAASADPGRPAVRRRLSELLGERDTSPAELAGELATTGALYGSPIMEKTNDQQRK
jgi:Flp pilus assembly protein TadD